MNYSSSLRIFKILFFLLFSLSSFAQDHQFEISEGRVYFKSDAPLELIEANSNDLRGIIQLEQRKFAFSVEVQTFEGFNSPLQRVHFNENYMESHKFSKATFSGKIIEKIDFSKDGIYIVRAKGKLNIHGVETERIIKSEVQVSGNKLKIKSKFSVLLKEHNLKIPKIVYQKIAEEIQVTIEANLSPKP